MALAAVSASQKGRSSLSAIIIHVQHEDERSMFAWPFILADRQIHLALRFQKYAKEFPEMEEAPGTWSAA
jgi:hypothetical protein